jgi:hypothetical protein
MTESRTAYRASKGGKRPGAGRKTNASKGLEIRERISLRLPPEIVEKLKQEEDYTALIEKLLRQHYQL